MTQKTVSRLLFVRMVAATAIVFASAQTSSLWGQAAKTAKKKGAAPAAKKSPQDKATPSAKKPTGENKLPDPESMTLVTKDGVQLRCTYFAPGKSDEGSDGKSVIPFLIVHDWESSRESTAPIARFLQMQGKAVLVPDLRGHGDSTQIDGSDKPLDVDKFRPNEIASAYFDLECCKKQLVKLNNEGKLNIDMLSVVAVGKSANLVTQWVIDDWYRWKTYSQENIKQGKDVKVLVLISPEKKLAKWSMNRLAAHQLFKGEKALPTIVSWGTGSSKAKDAESIYNRLEKNRPDRSEISKEDLSLFQAPLKGSSQSGDLIVRDPRNAKLWQYINKTVTVKIGQNADDYPWTDRSSKK